MRTYIKPVMESEVFVTNEFIGSCFLIDCNTCNIQSAVAGEAGTALGRPYTAQENAMSNFAQSLQGQVGEGYTNSEFVVYVDEVCCTCGDVTGEVDSLLEFFIWALVGITTGNWNWKPVTKGNNHHHLSISQITKPGKLNNGVSYGGNVSN